MLKLSNMIYIGVYFTEPFQSVMSHVYKYDLLHVGSFQTQPIGLKRFNVHGPMD